MLQLSLPGQFVVRADGKRVWIQRIAVFNQKRVEVTWEKTLSFRNIEYVCFAELWLTSVAVSRIKNGHNKCARSQTGRKKQIIFGPRASSFATPKR